MTRFEPATSGSTDRRSNQLSYIHHKSSIVIILIFGRFCQKNFPPRFCKPGRTNKQPLIESAAAEHKNSAGRAIPSAHANPPGAGVPQGRASHSNTQTLPGASTPPGVPIQAGTQSPPGTKIRPGHAISSGHTPPPGGRSARPRHANPAAPGVAQLFRRHRRLRGGQVAQALAHLVLCQHPLFRRPQAHL